MSWSKGLNMEIGVQHILLYGYVECSCSAVKTACFIEVDRMLAQGRAKMTGKKLMDEWKLRTFKPQERNTGLRPAMGVASQLPGRAH